MLPIIHRQLLSNLLLFFFLCIATNLYSATLNVPADYTTIQAAIDAAADGDTVLVAPGTYTGQISIFDKTVLLHSSDGPYQTYLTSSGESGSTIIATSNSNGTQIRGFTISDATRLTRAFTGLNFSNNLLIADNIFQNNSSILDPIYIRNSENVTIERNIFKDNNCGEDGDNDAAIIRLSGDTELVPSSSYIFRNNIVYNNRDAATAKCRSLVIQQNFLTSPPFNVSNNTFFNNTAAVGYLRQITSLNNDPTTHVFRNNIIVNNDIGMDIFSIVLDGNTDLDNPVWENNLVYGNQTNYQEVSDQTGINGNISSDPLFANEQLNDFRLSTGSPAIDTGSTSEAPVDDFDSKPRPIDGDRDLVEAIDIGAFEYSPNGVIEFEHDSYVVNEDSTILSINICRSEGTEGSVSATFSTSDGTAIDGVNYTLTNTSIVFSDGESGCKVVDIPIIDNMLLVGDVAFNISLSSPTGGVFLSALSTQLVELVDDEVDVSINKSTTQSSVDVGQSITYDIEVSNLQVTTARNVVVTDNLPEELTFISAVPSQGTCSGTTTIICDLGDVIANSSATIDLIVSANSAGEIINSANVVVAGVDLDSSNNIDSSPQVTIEGLPTAKELFPLVPLTKFNYQNNGVLQEDITIVAAGTDANNNPVFNLITSEGDASTYSNSDGLILYGETLTDGDVTRYDPSIKLLNAQPAIGDIIVSTGNATFDIVDIGVVVLPYTYTSEVVGFEDVTVPLGTYNAVKVTTNQVVSGIITVSGVDVSISIEQQADNWLVKEIGLVKQTVTTTSSSTVTATEIEINNYELLSISTPPEITSPLSSSGGLTGSSVTVTWDAMGTNATNWAVNVGTQGQGSKNILASPALGSSASSVAVTNLPTDGSSQVTFTLYAQIDGSWGIVDSETVTAFSGPAPASPEITSPLSSSGGLTGSSVTVTWDAMGTNATNWAVNVGTQGQGSKNILASPALGSSASSVAVTNLPTDGSSQVTFTLYAQIDGSWGIVDSETVTAFSGPAPASPEITSPLSSSGGLTGSSVTVTWDAMGTNATNWAVNVGTQGQGSKNILASPALGSSASSVAVTNLPTDGSSQVTFTLYAQIDGSWGIVDSETVTAFSGPAPASPEITSPLSSSGGLTGSSVTVTWDAMGTNATNWAVNVGTQGQGSKNILASPALGSSASSVAVTNLPTDGSSQVTFTLYAQIDGSWGIVDSETVTAFSGPAPASPEITSPLSSSGGLTGSSVTVTWDAMGTNATNWAVNVGTQGQGSKNILASPALGSSASSVAVTNLPTDGSSQVTFTLYAQIDGSWGIVDSETVTAFSGPAPASPEITSPLSSSGGLTGSSVTVTWDAMGTNATNWAVNVGTQGQGSKNILASPALGSSASSVAVTNLPTDGSSQVTFTLYAQIDGSWGIVDSETVTAVDWISGVFSVSGNFLETNCQDPADNGTSFITGTYNSNAQDGASYTGTLSISTIDGLVISTGGVSATGFFAGTHLQTTASGNYTLDALLSGVIFARNQGAFNATLTGDTISITMNGVDTIGGTCSLSGTLTGSR